MAKPLLVLLCLSAVTPAFAEPPGVPLRDAVPHMTVTGEAEAEVMPDQADLSLGVRRERKTADAATNATAEAATAVIAAIKGQGVALGDIHTSFSVSQMFDPKKDENDHVVGQTPRGYEAYETISVRVHDIGKVGPLARDLIAKGANSFEGVSFSYAKAKQKGRDLDTEAMRDALVQARIYAEAVGLKLGRVLQIGEDPVQAGGDQADLPSRRAPRVYAGAVVIPTEPGLQTLRSSVTVIFEIEGTAR